MDEPLLLFLLAVVSGYVYAFVAGFTDAADAIATSVGSRVLTPKAAVLMAAAFNLLGGLTGTAVALTIGRDILDAGALSLFTVVAGVAGAMTWSLAVYFLGIPVSETHGLIGGLVGAGVATAGWDAVQFDSLRKVLAAILASPVLGFVGGLVLIVAIYRVFHKRDRRRVMPMFVNLQRASAAFMAFSHGRNDAQKPMGIIALAIALYYDRPVTVPLWIIVTAASVAAFGTALGGWRIIHTLGMRVTRLDPVGGFAVETSGAGVLQLASQLGIPVSTTHAVTSSLLGVGAARRFSAVRWGITSQIMVSWALTVPVAMVLGAIYATALEALFA